MTRVFSYFLICSIGILGAGAVAAQVEGTNPVSTDDALVTETKDFQVYCFTDRRCAASNVTKKQRRSVQRGLEELQEARGWLEGMGFNVKKANMDKGTDGKKAMRLQFDRAIHERNCGDMAGACRILSASRQGRVILPIENADRLTDGEVLVHEYVHTIQPSRNDGKALWLNEMVATAIGSAWVRKRAGNKKVYQPKYSMTLDREFWDGEDDPGYGKWDYAITLGENIGSADGVAYLAQDRFINATNNPESINGNSMALFYDEALVKEATFDTLFPKYVARFNNVERDIQQKDRSGKYFYYGDIAKHSVDVPVMGAPFQTTFDGEVVPFAAYPMLLSLKLPPPAGDSVPADNIFAAEVKVTEVMDRSNLTLVREHRLAVEKHRDLIMIDGNDAPDELGFYRVVNTPAPDSTANVEFSLAVRTRPITFEPPACFQAGKPSVMVANGLTGAPADNWRLKVNNGSVKGLVVTPASAGTITVEVEIDSPITRDDRGITPVTPTKTRVNLGTFDVASDECELRLAGNITASFSGKVGGMMPHLGGGLTEQGQAHWKAILDIKTKAPRPDPDPFLDEEQTIYPNHDSSFQLSGSFKYELCQTANRVCIRWVKETYRGTGPIAADGGDLDIFTKDGKVWLEAKLPVLTTWTEHVNETVERTETFVQHWEIGCRSTGKWWSTRLMRGYAGHVLAMDTPLVGTWTSRNHDEIEFKCVGQWAGSVETTGEYSSSMELQGRVKALIR